MFSLICLIAFSGIFTNNSEIQVQAIHYNNNIESSHLVSESIWALSHLYYSAPNSDRTQILEYISDENINNALLENKNTVTFINEINQYYSSETLLLYQLLRETNQAQKELLFEDFYQENSFDQLYDLNYLIVTNSEVDSESLNPSEIRFEHYLITQFRYVNSYYTDEWLSKLNKIWVNKYPAELLSLNDEIKLLTIFNSLYLIRDFNSIPELYNSIREIKFHPKSAVKRDVLWDLDFALYRAGQIDKSLQIQREFTIPLSQYLNDIIDLNTIYTSQGGYLYILGRFQEAREIFNRSLEYEDQLSDLNLSRLYNNLSLIYFKTGEANLYISTQLKALEHAESIKNYDHQLNIYRNLHIFYVKNRNWEQADNYINLAINLAEEQNNVDDLISLYSFKASFVEQAYRDYERAYDLLGKAELLFSDESDVRTMTRALYEKSRILRLNSRYEESKSALNQILDNFSSELNQPSFLELLLQLARLELIQNNSPEAKALLSEFRAHDISVVDFPVFVLYQTLRGEILQSESQFSEVQKIYNQTASMIFERTRNSADFESVIGL